MKTLSIVLTALLLGLNACGQTRNDGDTVISNNPENLKLKVLYFHITNRCNTCRGIEANVRKTLDEQFKNEVETGVIGLYILNSELQQNKEMVEKYEAYGATLALTMMQNGKEIRTDDLTLWAFQTTHDPGAFAREFSEKIREALR